MPKVFKVTRGNLHAVREQIGEFLNECVQLDGGDGGSGQDGQVLTGQLFFYDAAAQRTNLIWSQEETLLENGGYSVADYDPELGLPIEPEDIVTFLGLSENQDAPGEKASGLFFVGSVYPGEIRTTYDGSMKLQNVNFPMQIANQPLFFPNAPPPEDAYSLNSLANGVMYWVPPPTPPNVQEDTDVTDVPVAVDPATTTLPVTIASDQDSVSPAIVISFRALATQQNTELTTQLLLNGVPVAGSPPISEVIPRNVGRDIRHQWSPPQIFTGDVVQIRVMSSDTGMTISGTQEATILTLVHPEGVGVSQTSAGLSVITPFSFWSRWLDSEKENLMRYINRAPPGPLPSWIDVFRVSAMFASQHQNVNLASSHLILDMAFIELEGIIGPGRAAAILAF